MQDLRKVVPPERVILDEITLAFLPGAKIGVLGANGAGKSTLLRIMAGIDTEFLGEARPAPGIRVGHLPQEPELDPKKDVLGNVEEGVAETRALLRRFEELSARFAEPLSIFFAVQLTMYGAAACYRAHVHLRLQVFVKMLPSMAQHVIEIGVHLLMGTIAVLMIVYGASLTQTTWFQSYPEFEYVRVGLVYSAIPGSGLVTLLFVIEAILFRHTEEEADEEMQRALEHADEERRRLAAGHDEHKLA